MSPSLTSTITFSETAMSLCPRRLRKPHVALDPSSTTARTAHHSGPIHNVWFNSTCYHPPRAYPRDLPLFSYKGGLFPTTGTQQETIPHPRDSPLVTHCTPTQKRNNAALCVQNQDNNIYFYAKPNHKHIRNTRCR